MAVLFGGMSFHHPADSGVGLYSRIAQTCTALVGAPDGSLRPSEVYSCLNANSVFGGELCRFAQFLTYYWR